nr:HAMP domain-containing sensor histidine kinase [Parvularcula dongshanensis]
MFEFDYDARAVVDGVVVTESRPAVGRVATFRYGTPDGKEVRAIILAARDIRDIDQIRQDARNTILRLGSVTLFLGLVLGSIYSGAFLRRVDAIGRTVRAIRDGDLSRRVALTGSDDEFDTLSTNINGMLDQIERLMTGMRQVSDNIAHDLRSPLTRIKARLETAMGDPQADKDEVIERTTMDVERLLATFNALLSITRIESGEGGGSKVPVDVAAVAEEMLELYEPAADEAGFALHGHVERVPDVLGNRELISQLIANLLDNALKYGRRPTETHPAIELTVVPRPSGGVLLSVMDNGPGVSEGDRERILQRFVRLERSRSTSGNGLGLSLVAAIARRHNAQLTIGRGLPHDPDARGLVPPTAYGLGVRIAFPPAPEKPKPSKPASHGALSEAKA